MNRAFVKESDAGNAADLPELPISAHPNHITPRGLAQLHARLDEALRQRGELEKGADAVARQSALAPLQREIRWLQARIASAMPVDVATQPSGRVAFGATVEVLDEDGAVHEYRIVGEDEANAEQGLVSWISPLARALLGAGIGDEVTWRRPAGDLAIEVRSIRYDEV